MTHIIALDRSGKKHEIEADADDAWSVMEIMKDYGLAVEALCGGCTSCATCHVYVDENWQAKLEPMEDEEQELLEDCVNYNEKASRLSCQIEFTEELSGLTVTLAPEE